MLKGKSFLDYTYLFSPNEYEKNDQIMLKDVPSGLSQFLAAKSPLQMLNFFFYFTSNTFFFHKIFKFLSWLLGDVAKRLDNKDKINCKFCDLTAWLTTWLKHILPNISWSKGNQTMTVDQLIVYKMRDIFLKNHTQNVVEKLFPHTFLKN